eukprot:8141362-Karenia_brevis.AAC.1
MTEETRNGPRRCVLETSRREFAVRDMMEKHNGQFGQRVHLGPKSASGRAYMHEMSGGWSVAPFDGM